MCIAEVKVDSALNLWAVADRGTFYKLFIHVSVALWRLEVTGAHKHPEESPLWSVLLLTIMITLDHTLLYWLRLLSI